jgi:predicted membrane protein
MPASCGRYLLASKMRADMISPESMMESDKEIILAKVRLHWGIFVPVFFGAIAVFLPAMFWLLLAHQAVNMISQTLAPINHGAGFRQPELIWLIPFAPLVAMTTGLLIEKWLSFSKSEIVLTNRRLSFRTGFLWRRSRELPLENVEAIYISESLLGRICGYGTVTVTSVGGAGFPLLYIGSPQIFHGTLQNAVLNAKNTLRGAAKLPEPTSGRQDADARYRPR